MCINIVSTQSAAGMLSTDVNTNKHQDTEDTEDTIGRMGRVRRGNIIARARLHTAQHKVATEEFE